MQVQVGNRVRLVTGAGTQEADSPKCSKTMPKVVVGVPWVLKVFSWVFIYKFYKNTVFGPKKLVQPR